MRMSKTCTEVGELSAATSDGVRVDDLVGRHGTVDDMDVVQILADIHRRRCCI